MSRKIYTIQELANMRDCREFKSKHAETLFETAVTLLGQIEGLKESLPNVQIKPEMFEATLCEFLDDLLEKDAYYDMVIKGEMRMTGSRDEYLDLNGLTTELAVFSGMIVDALQFYKEKTPGTYAVQLAVSLYPDDVGGDVKVVPCAKIINPKDVCAETIECSIECSNVDDADRLLASFANSLDKSRLLEVCGAKLERFK